jgi:hypothetical protein
MKLLTKAIIKTIPQTGATDGQGDAAIVHAKLFTPSSNWTWYVTEYDSVTGNAFGLVEGFETELGYFNVDELAAIKVPVTIRLGGRGISGTVTVERDRSFTPRTLGVVRAEIDRRQLRRA